MPGLGWDCVSGSVEGIWKMGGVGLGLGGGSGDAERGWIVRYRGRRMTKDGYTTEITAVEKFCLNFLPVMFRCLALDDFEHAG